jgi:hypothetical protein
MLIIIIIDIIIDTSQPVEPVSLAGRDIEDIEDIETGRNRRGKHSGPIQV